MVIHKQVLSQILKDEEMVKILFPSSFYQKNKSKNHRLAEFVLVIPCEYALVSDSYQVEVSHTIDQHIHRRSAGHRFCVVVCVCGGEKCL